MDDKLFFGEIEKESKKAVSEYMALRGSHKGTIENKIGSDDLKEYDNKESEEE